jgi:hypothetical protein
MSIAGQLKQQLRQVSFNSGRLKIFEKLGSKLN